MASSGGDSPVRSLAPVSIATPFRERERPVCHGAAGGAMLLDRFLPLRVWQLAFVDKEGFMAAAAFALENVRWHCKGIVALAWVSDFGGEVGRDATRRDGLERGNLADLAET